jgi:3-deoxy-D-manno-octulosonate 8-phosphate phosphatase (KDO 8-P phosphatase)
MPVPLSPRELRLRARRVKLLLMDVDGVMTDGRIYYVPHPQRSSREVLFETKTFHSRDGLGIRLAHEAGLKTGIISGRGSLAVEYRARELGLDYVEQNALEKLGPYEKILREARLEDAEICYMGDDIVDLPVLRRVGLAVGVGDGHELLRKHVHYWTVRPGGAGAVRETIELILSAQGKLRSIFRHYLEGAQP